MSLDGKVAIVTGASSGLGAALAADFAAAGAHVEQECVTMRGYVPVALLIGSLGCSTPPATTSKTPAANGAGFEKLTDDRRV